MKFSVHLTGDDNDNFAFIVRGRFDVAVVAHDELILVIEEAERTTR